MGHGSTYFCSSYGLDYGRGICIPSLVDKAASVWRANILQIIIIVYIENNNNMPHLPTSVQFTYLFVQYRV